MLSRRPVAAALALALVAPVTALVTSSTATAAPTPSAKKVAAKHLPRPARGTHTRAHDPHTVLVKFRPTAAATTRDRALSSRGGHAGAALPGTGFVRVHTNGSADELASRLGADPSVAEVTLDYVRQASATPNDPAFAYDQDYLKTVRVPTAWDRSKGSLNQVVAVIDTGVDGTHPDLLGRTVAGYNAITNAPIPAGAASDDNGHGSMVSGIIAAGTDNGEGIAGVAWTAKVMPVKVLDANGAGADSDVVEGINWAVSQGAKILNLSLGGDADSPVLHAAVTNAVAHGAVVVVAAGNWGDDVPQYPAAYPEAVAVGATDTSGGLTDFSSYGPWVDVTAPGWGILSTTVADATGNDNYAYGDGTSFSAPIVAGVVALIRTQSPTLTPAQVLARLRSTARDAGPRGVDPYYGAGVVDATNALGGGWAPDFTQPAPGAGEPNDVPARATPFTDFSYGTYGTLDVEGDVDWYTFTSTSTRAVQVRVNPSSYNPDSPQNLDLVLSVYNADLALIGTADAGAAGESESLTFMTGPGTYYVTVRNYNGARDPRAYDLHVTDTGAGHFDPAVQVPVPTGGTGPVAVGDVTGDGLPDIIAGGSWVGSPAFANQLYVVPRQNDGTWGTPQGLQTVDSSLVRNLVVTDLDRDGHNDVLAATAVGVQVFAGNAAGTLDPPVTIAGTTGANAVEVADLDLDGKPDLAVSTASDVAVLSRDAQGAWQRTAVSGTGGTQLRVGDLDGDSRPDLAVVGTTGVRVLHHRADGWTETTLSMPAANSYAAGIEIADVTGDGRADLSAVYGTNAPAAGLAVWRQTDGGDLAAPTVAPLNNSPTPLEAADMNGDGLQDLVTVHLGYNFLSLFEQQADGTLAPASTSYTTQGSGNTVTSLALEDVTQDGRRDVVVGTSDGVDVLRNAGGATPGGERSWVRATSVPDFAQRVSLSAAPSVSFARDVAPASVSASTVSLLDGRTGAPVPAAVTYDGGTRTATISPSTPLHDNAPYRLTVSGVTDTSGATMGTAYSSTFQTVDVAPPAVGSFTATGGVRAAALAWTAPAITDLDRYVVRMAAGTTPPASPTTGTGVYSGTGTSVTVPNLVQGSTYSFRIWAQDRTGTLSAASTRTLVGTAETMSSNVTSLTYGGSATLTSRLTRRDTGAAIAGVPVQLSWRKVGTTTWNLLTTRTSSSTGTVSFTHKPSTSVEYLWTYRGSTGFVGSSSSVVRVGLRTAVTSTASRTSLPLGGSFSLYGSVSPSHAGQRVYLQRYAGSGRWTTVTSTVLTSTSAYSFAIKPSARGTFTYRVYKAADADHLASYGPSRAVKVT
ncbi:S8 family serine peptidase [Terrabacter carboxydivorans]|uniref:Fibronectin type-III domain-containing protein n=1 Tax=Terrabacter carboxydivorans TaxID=619730 RepID=A0ABP5Z3H5_9MICO